MAHARMVRAYEAQETAQTAQLDAMVAGMDVQNAEEEGADHYAAHEVEYHTAALEDAAAAGVIIKQ
jgi:predicted transcriptional regulator YdeE